MKKRKEKTFYLCILGILCAYSKEKVKAKSTSTWCLPKTMSLPPSRKQVPAQKATYIENSYRTGNTARQNVAWRLSPYSRGMLNYFRVTPIPVDPNSYHAQPIQPSEASKAMVGNYVTELDALLGFQIKMLERSSASEFSGVCPKTKLERLISLVATPRDMFAIPANVLKSSLHYETPDFMNWSCNKIRWATFNRATGLMEIDKKEPLTSWFDMYSLQSSIIAGTLESIYSNANENANEIDLLYQFLLSTNNWSALYWENDQHEILLDEKTAKRQDEKKQTQKPSAPQSASETASATSGPTVAVRGQFLITEEYKQKVSDEYLNRDSSKENMTKYYDTVRLGIENVTSYIRYMTALASAIETTPHLLHSSVTPRLGYLVTALMCLPPNTFAVLQKQLLTAVLTLSSHQIGPLPRAVLGFSSREDLVRYIHEHVTGINSGLRFWAFVITVCRLFATREYTTHEHAPAFKSKVLFALNNIRQCGSNLVCCQMIAPNEHKAFTNESLAEFVMVVSKTKADEKHFQMADFKAVSDPLNGKYPELDKQIQTNIANAAVFAAEQKKHEEELAKRLEMVKLAKASSLNEKDSKDTKTAAIHVVPNQKNAQWDPEVDEFLKEQEPKQNFLELVNVFATLAYHDQDEFLVRVIKHLNAGSHVYVSGVLTARFVFRVVARSCMMNSKLYAYCNKEDRHLAAWRRTNLQQGALGAYLQKAKTHASFSSKSTKAGYDWKTSKTSSYGASESASGIVSKASATVSVGKSSGGSAGLPAIDANESADKVVCKMIPFESAFQRFREMRIGLGISECMVCLEDANLFPLHGDKRHSLCKPCMTAIRAKDALCPQCRKPI